MKRASIKGTAIVKEDGSFIAIDDDFCCSIGIPFEQLREMILFDLVYISHIEEFKCQMEKAKSSQESFVMRILSGCTYDAARIRLSPCKTQFSNETCYSISLTSAQRQTDRKCDDHDTLRKKAISMHEIKGLVGRVTGIANLIAMSGEVEEHFYHILGETADMLVGYTQEAIFEIKNQIDYCKEEKVNLNIQKLIGDILKPYAAQYPSKHFEFEFDDRINPHVIGDKLKIQRIFLNLLNNAVKFTPTAGSKIVVKAERKASHSRGKFLFQEIMFSVSDNGIGINPKMKDKLFQEFSRLDASREGSGLGLFICKNMIENMQGQFGFTSEPGNGTTFSFALTLASKVKTVPLSKAKEWNAQGKQVSFSWGTA